MALVTRLGSEYPVVILSKTSCSMTHSIKTVLELKWPANVMELKALGRKPSVPAVFIGQELIGGSNEIFSLHLKGKLVPWLLNANAIWL
ncbi:hypothetical protein DCAR_0624319 [Daucus carota subsp. sativus]|uniref:Glutaredoxin domain-containing protein n=1 Tax=Daucus carota subsp. sativus TaxID=79200 RepID=A0AAF0XDB1_DAUCS|nr:hypothetical protein DCAR_0624319 [Daucus carota subsp. sativus]